MAGAIKDPIHAVMDHAQRRVSKDRLVLFGQASREGQGGKRVSSLDLLLTSSDIWQDFTTFTAMLRPQPTREEWFTSNSGANAKLAASALTLSSGDWDELQNQQAVGPWHGKRDKSTSGTILTNASYSKNRAFSVAAFVFARGEIYEALRGGWNSSASISGGVGWKLFSDGFLEIYKAGSKVGEGTVTLGSSAGGIDSQIIHLMFIPGRRRELLVLSITPGGGFSHTFIDIDEDDPDPQITPAGKFWVQINPGTSFVQMAPITFATSGYIIFPPSFFAEAPESGRTAFNEAYFDYSFIGGETVTPSMREVGAIGTAFTPDGVKTTARIRVDVSAGGSSTPMIYGASCGYQNEFADTDDSESVDLITIGRDLTWSVPDQNSGVRASIEVPKPESSGIQQWSVLSNRPCEIRCGDVQIIDGRTLPPRYKIRPSEDAMVCMFDIEDQWAALRRYRFRDRVILSGQNLKTALETLISGMTGIEVSRIDISPDPGITISPAPAPVAGEWVAVVEEGETGDQVISKLFNRYLGGWFYGFVPGNPKTIFKARPPVTVADAADVTIYQDVNDAIDALVLEGMTTAEARHWSAQRTAHEIEYYSLGPEATEVRVTGFDARERRPLQAFYRDSVAEDPTLAPSLRPENWQGERLGYGLLDSILSDQGLVNEGADKLGDALTRVRKFASIESSVLFKSDGVPLYRGDVLGLDGTYKFRVRALNMTSRKEPTSATATGRDAWMKRKANYLVELMEGTTSPWGLPTGARAVADMSGRLFYQFQTIANPFREIKYP